MRLEADMMVTWGRSPAPALVNGLLRSEDLRSSTCKW